MNAPARRRAATLSILILGTAAALGACDVFGPRGEVLRDELRRNENRWQQAGAPTTYAMTVLQATDAVPEPDAVRLEIVGGVIVAGTTVEDEQPVPPAVLATYHTVPGMFGLIRDALNRRAPAIAVTYDPEYGFPRELFIDYDQSSSGDDIYIAVTNLAFVD